MSTEKDQPKTPAINQATKDLADKLGDQIKTAAKSSENIDNSLWTAHLPEGVTAEVDEKLRDHRITFQNATALAFGRAMTDIVADSKGTVEKGTISIGMGGRDAVEHQYSAKETFVNRMDKDNPVEVTKHGHMVTKLTIAGTSGSSGQLGAVRKTIGQQAAERLAK
jgi:hypothetical protein